MKSILALLLIAITPFGGKTELPNDVLKSIEKRISLGLNSSIAIGIIDKNGPQYYSFGSKKKNGAPVDEHTIYEIGSVTKVFTSTLLADMVLKNQVKLEDPVQKFLPQHIKLEKKGTTKMTLGHLADHTAGYPQVPDNMTPAVASTPFADYTVDQLYDYISNYSPPREVGLGYKYSNVGAGLLGLILSQQSQMSYEELLIKTITEPLEMNETKITFDENMIQNLAQGYYDGSEIQNWDLLPSLEGAGAIRSSVYDLLKFVSANLGLNKSPLSPTFDLAHTVRHSKRPGNNRVGLAWNIIRTSKGDIINHNGKTGGYYGFIGFNKEIGKGVVVLSNSNVRIDDIGVHLLDPEWPLNEVKVKPKKLPHVSEEMLKTLQQSGDTESAISKYFELKASSPNEYNFDEKGLLFLGYDLMQGYKSIKVDLASSVAVLKLMVEEHPNSPNAYDSYAEALMKIGQKEMAIQNYQKSMELNPGNTNGVKMLSELGVKYEKPKVVIPDNVLENYTGLYQYGNGKNEMLITKEGSKMFIKVTNVKKMRLLPRSLTSFYLGEVDIQIELKFGQDNKVEGLTFYQNGNETYAGKAN